MKLDADRIQHWLGVGAQPSDRVLRFLDAAGIRERAARNNPQKGEPGEKAKERIEERAKKEAQAAEAAAAPQEAEAVVAEEVEAAIAEPTAEAEQVADEVSEQTPPVAEESTEAAGCGRSSGRGSCRRGYVSGRSRQPGRIDRRAGRGCRRCRSAEQRVRLRLQTPRPPTANRLPSPPRALPRTRSNWLIRITAASAASLSLRLPAPRRQGRAEAEAVQRQRPTTSPPIKCYMSEG